MSIDDSLRGASPSSGSLKTIPKQHTDNTNMPLQTSTTITHTSTIIQSRVSSDELDGPDKDGNLQGFVVPDSVVDFDPEPNGYIDVPFDNLSFDGTDDDDDDESNDGSDYKLNEDGSTNKDEDGDEIIMTSTPSRPASLSSDRSILSPAVCMTEATHTSPFNSAHYLAIKRFYTLIESNGAYNATLEITKDSAVRIEIEGRSASWNNKTETPDQREATLAKEEPAEPSLFLSSEAEYSSKPHSKRKLEEVDDEDDIPLPKPLAAPAKRRKPAGTKYARQVRAVAKKCAGKGSRAGPKPLIQTKLDAFMRLRK